MKLPAKDQVISPCIFRVTHRSHLELSSGPHPESTISSHTLQDVELPKLPELAMPNFRTVLHPGSAALAGASLYVGLIWGHVWPHHWFPDLAEVTESCGTPHVPVLFLIFNQRSEDQVLCRKQVTPWVTPQI